MQKASLWRYITPTKSREKRQEIKLIPVLKPQLWSSEEYDITAFIAITYRYTPTHSLTSIKISVAYNY